MAELLEPGEWLRLCNRRYRILERLTAGDALVQRYKAVDPDSRPGGEPCALHVLPVGEKTLDYVRVLKRASERNSSFLPMLSYHPWQTRGGQRWAVLVLPWMSGQTLREYLNAAGQRGPGISVFEAFRLFRGLAHGVCRLSHRLNIVHGDIKPENLIVCREPTQLVLVDFGSAWLVESATRRMPLDGHTRAYAAPERIRGVPLPDFRSDQFSVTAVFYEMLTLTRAFGGLGGAAAEPGNESYRELPPANTRCRDRSKVADQVWRGIDGLISTGLEFDREARYANRRDWLDAVDAVKFELDKSSRMDAGQNTLAAWMERLDRGLASVAGLFRRQRGNSRAQRRGNRRD